MNTLMDARTIQIPDVDTVDFNDPMEVESYVGLMMQAGSEADAFMPGSRPAAGWERVRRTAKVVAGRLEALFPSMPPAQKIMSEMAYDMAHRIGYRTAADQGILNKNLLEAFDARIHGDKAVDEYVLYRRIDRRIFQRDRIFFDKPLAWMILCLRDWLESRDKQKPDYDQISRTTILLDSKIGAYVGGNPEQYKKELFRRNRRYLDRTYSDIRDLMALDQFLLASLRYLPDGESDRYRAAITDALIAHSGTNRFYRELLRNRV